MIKVLKKKSLCPHSFTLKAIEETKNNCAAVKKKKYGEVGFRAYKDDDLVEALETIFNYKCAYCEAQSAKSSPWDIEHFRPKSRTFRKGEPRIGFIGYYWLAADWDNLLLACINCNRKKQHRVPGKKDKVTIGKHEQFPLDTGKEKLRCQSPDPKKLSAEDKVRLLIHPCKEDPELYFEFDESGAAPGNILPKTSLSGFKLRKAEKSIEVYALHRIDLVKARAKHLDELKFKTLVIDREIETYDATTGLRKQKAINNIQEYIDRLVDYALPDKEFVALSKQYIGKYLKKINPSIKRVIGKTYG
jgi:uncharacterized protein (TIGR02646 family)